MTHKTRHEYIQEHILLFRNRYELEKELTPEIGKKGLAIFFAEYETLGIKPTQFSKKASEHKTAVRVLKNCITNLVDFKYFIARNSETFNKYHINIEDILTPE